MILHIRVVRRLNLVRGGTGRTAIETRLMGRSAEIRGSFGRALAALGGLLPLGEDDRAKITVSLGRAGYRVGQCDGGAHRRQGGVRAGRPGPRGLAVLPPLVPGVALLGWAAGLVGGLLLGVMLNLLPEMVVARLAASRYRKNPRGADRRPSTCSSSASSRGRRSSGPCSGRSGDLRMFRPELAAELRQASLDMSVHGRARGRRARTPRDAPRQPGPARPGDDGGPGGAARHAALADALRKLGGSLRVQQIATMQGRMARLPVLLILPTMAGVLPGNHRHRRGARRSSRLTESLGEFGG